MTIQVDLALPFDDAMRGVQAEDSLGIEIEGGDRIPLGVPKPAGIQGARQPFFLPVSALLAYGDLELLAKGPRLTATFAARRIPFHGSDVASTNALYRVITCSAGRP